jgi:DEAD/DEAH box helicase domain-containing protein
VVVVELESDRVLAEMDFPSAHTMLHEQAIYQHDGECWQVERFDYDNHKAFVRRVAPDYWTDAMTYVQISVIEESASGPVVNGEWSGTWGEVAIVEKVVGYKKIKFYTHENAGYGDVRLPEMQMHTTAFWLTVPEQAGGRIIDGLRGIGLALETVATLALMCDPRDLGTTLGDANGRDPAAAGVAPEQSGSPNAGYSPTLFLYEHVPGGTGLAERIWEQRDVLLARALRMIESCPCDAGCPACVGPGESSRKTVAIDLLHAVIPTA